MKVDAGLGHQLERVPASAKEVEAMGFDGVRTAEMNHDPFFPLLLAAEHTQKIELISFDCGRLRAQPDAAREHRPRSERLL